MKLIGMNCTLMRQYIEFVADRLLLELGFSKVNMVGGLLGLPEPGGGLYSHSAVDLFRFSE